MTKTKNAQRESRVRTHRHLHLLSIAAILMTCVSITATVLLAIKYQKVVDENTSLKTGYTTEKWQPKQEILTPNFGITLEGVDVDDKGVPDHLPLPEGYIFIAVDISVRNVTAEEKLFLPMDHTYIRDESGLRYDLTAAPNVETGIAGSVMSGDTARGQIGFMVPKGQKNLTFYFEPYGDGAGKTAAFDLSSLL
jgi:hypothetical protein